MEGEPQSQENLKQDIVARLHFLMTQYIDGIPNDIKHSTSGDSGWKVQKLWFQGIVGELDDILRKSDDGKVIISRTLLEKIEAYVNSLTTSGFHQRLTTQADINRAQEIINEVIAELEK